MDPWILWAIGTVVHVAAMYLVHHEELSGEVGSDHDYDGLMLQLIGGMVVAPLSMLCWLGVYIAWLIRTELNEREKK